MAVLCLLVGAGALIYKGVSYDDLLGKLHSIHLPRLPSLTTVQPSLITAEPQIMQPPPSAPWCKVQEVAVAEDRESPTRDSIMGWDAVNECCVRRVEGYNCALKRQASVDYCYTGNIGGVIKWVTVDNAYKDAANYKQFVKDQDREEVPNKQCDAAIYQR